MNNKTTFVDSLLMVTGFTYSLANIEQILGIIILVIQIIWFAIKAYIYIANILKDGITVEELEKAADDLQDLGEEVSDFADNTKP